MKTILTVLFLIAASAVAALASGFLEKDASNQYPIQGPAYYQPRVKSMGTKGTFVCYSTQGRVGAIFKVTTGTPPANTDYLMYFSNSNATFPLTEEITVIFRSSEPKVCLVGYSTASVKNGRALYF